MIKVIVWLGAIVLVGALVLGIDWGLWKLWLWVLPQLYPTGPVNVVQPGFWLFVGATTLLGFAFRLIRGR